MSALPPYISRLPAGLLDLLGTKTMGANPRVLTEFVQPTLELRDLYLALQEELLQTITPTTIAGAGAPGTITGMAESIVPAGELWLVKSAVVQAAASAAGTGCKVQAGWGRNQAGVNVPYWSSEARVIDSTTATADWQLITLPEMLLPPQSVLWVANLAGFTGAGNITYSFRINFTRLSI